MHWKGSCDRILKSAPPWKILFLGTDNFALTIVKALYADLMKRYLPHRSDTVVERLDIVTKKSQGQVSKSAALWSADVRHHVWPDVDIRPGEFDVGVVASFGHMIPKSFIQLFPYGILNVHPSLLPRWRGCAPIPSTIYHGDEVTGVTIQEIQPHRFDIGPIVNRLEMPVPAGITSEELSHILAEQGAELIMKTLRDLPHLEDKEIDQNDKLATYAQKIHINDPKLFIDWENESCRKIDRKFRAFKEMHDLRTYFGEHKVRLRNPTPMKELWWYTFHDQYHATHPGCAEYIRSKDVLGIQCKDGIIGVRELVVKKPQTAKTFHNGYLSTAEKKYRRFTHSPQSGHDKDTKPKVMSRHKLMKQQQCWQLQLLRMGASKADG